jgi:branched-subunit amino acid aminotransferase/4-amino-4-deoxychorismate lyase
MNPGAHVVLNGALLPRDVARITIDDLGYLTGEGVFETLRADAGVPASLAAHVERLFTGLDALQIPETSTPDVIAADIDRALDANGLKSGTARIRITVTRGGSMALALAGAASSRLVTADPYEPPAAALYTHGVEVAVSKHLRHAHPLHRIKATSWLWNAWQRRESHDESCFEVLQYNTAGQLAEGSFTNVFVVDAAGRLQTPHPDEGCLPGVTRAAVLQLARACGWNVREGGVDEDMVRAATEVFLTSSLLEIMPVRAIDGRLVGDGIPGPVTRALREAYALRVRGRRSVP